MIKKYCAAIALPLLLASARAAPECQLTDEKIATLDFEAAKKDCKLGGTPTFDDCDVCFASLLGNIFLPIFPELGFSYDEIPADPSMIAQELQGGDFGGCQDKLQELFSENSFGAAEIGGLVSCPMDQGWGDLTIEEFREYNPDFLKDAPPTGEGM